MLAGGAFRTFGSPLAMSQFIPITLILIFIFKLRVTNSFLIDHCSPCVATFNHFIDEALAGDPVHSLRVTWNIAGFILYVL